MGITQGLFFKAVFDLGEACSLAVVANDVKAYVNASCLGAGGFDATVAAVGAATDVEVDGRATTVFDAAEPVSVTAVTRGAMAAEASVADWKAAWAVTGSG